MTMPDRICINPGLPAYTGSRPYLGFDVGDLRHESWPIYLALHGPTLTAVREALRKSIEKMWDYRLYVGGKMGDFRSRHDIEKDGATPKEIIEAMAALRMLEGEG